MEERIASAVLDTYGRLPKRGKPREGEEWTVVAGIVLERDADAHGVVVAAVCSGQRCLNERDAALAAGGLVVDGHAEIMALRAFNRWLLEHLDDQTFFEAEADDIGRRVWRAEWRVHLAITELPCGDASMESTMALQEDATPWALPPAAAEAEPSAPLAAAAAAQGSRSAGGPLRGRAYFGELGRVRTKPGRADAIPTTCKSCTDKLKLSMLCGVLRGPLRVCVAPQNLRLRSLVLPTLTPAQAIGVHRAFRSPEASLEIRQSVLLADFAHRRAKGRIPLHSALVHIPQFATEHLGKGRNMGARPGSVKAQPCICKRALWRAVLEHSPRCMPLDTCTYRAWKETWIAGLSGAGAAARERLGMHSSHVDDAFTWAAAKPA